MNLRPSSASLAEISEALQILFDALPFQRGHGADNVAAAYVEALRGVTLDALQAGIRKFLRGECQDVNPRFVPTPPELSRIVRNAVVPSRIPPERRIAAPDYQDMPGAKARMRLKMPMYNHAVSCGLMDELDKANRAGFSAIIALADRWGIAIPMDLLSLPPAEAERQWNLGRSQAWTEINRNPPPFLRRRRAA